MVKDNLPIPLSLSGKYSDSFLMLSSENSVAKLSNRNFLLLGWIGARIVLFSLKFMVMIKDFCRCSVCYLLLCSSSLTEKIGQTGTFRAGAGCKYRSSAHCCYSQHLVLVSKNWEHLYFDPYLAMWGELSSYGGCLTEKTGKCAFFQDDVCDSTEWKSFAKKT